jgi:hypothetical protein
METISRKVPLSEYAQGGPQLELTADREVRGGLLRADGMSLEGPLAAKVDAGRGSRLLDDAEAVKTSDDEVGTDGSRQRGRMRVAPTISTFAVKSTV